MEEFFRNDIASYGNTDQGVITFMGSLSEKKKVGRDEGIEICEGRVCMWSVLVGSIIFIIREGRQRSEEAQRVSLL